MLWDAAGTSLNIKAVACSVETKLEIEFWLFDDKSLCGLSSGSFTAGHVATHIGVGPSS